MNWQCLIGFHKWVKWGGYCNEGKGKFSQRFICEKCKKMKTRLR